MELVVVVVVVELMMIVVVVVVGIYGNQCRYPWLVVKVRDNTA